MIFVGAAFAPTLLSLSANAAAVRVGVGQQVMECSVMTQGGDVGRELHRKDIATVGVADKSDGPVVIGDVAWILLEGRGFSFAKLQRLFIRAQAARKLSITQLDGKADLTPEEAEALKIYQGMLDEVRYLAGCIRSGLVEVDETEAEAITDILPDEQPFNIDLLKPAERWSPQDYRQTNEARDFLNYWEIIWAAELGQRPAPKGEELAELQRAAFVSRWRRPPRDGFELQALRPVDAPLSAEADGALREFLRARWLTVQEKQ